MTSTTKMILTYLVSCFISLTNSVTIPENGNALFDNSYLQETIIESNSIVDLWNAISREYVMVNVTVVSIALYTFWLKLTGFTSSVSPRKPLKIDINE